MKRMLCCVASAGLVLGGARVARAHDSPAPAATRAEVLQRARAEKQQSAEPYEPNALERGMKIAEERAAPLLNARDGVHWKVGSLATGSGLAFGAGYRHRRLANREAAFTTWAGGSLKRYWAAEARFDAPSLAKGRVALGTYLRHHSYPQEDFFGVGPDARRSDHTKFGLTNTLVGGRAAFKPAPIVTVGAGLEYSRPDVDRGKGGVSIEQRFDGVSAPGLGDTASFLKTSGSFELDYRQPKNARRGGWYRLEASRFSETDDRFSFNRFDVDLRQYASILAERRVLAVRLFVSTSEPADGASVPFYLMPALGGHDTLRGFRNYRFRGPHALLTQTEYRWEIWSGLDAALFYDAGKVAARREDLSFRRLEDAYGFGFRFNTDNGTILRIDAGFGSADGKHLYIVFGDVF